MLILQGMSNPENVYFFNHENIKEIIFKDFVNEDEWFGKCIWGR